MESMPLSGQQPMTVEQQEAVRRVNRGKKISANQRGLLYAAVLFAPSAEAKQAQRALDSDEERES